MVVELGLPTRDIDTRHHDRHGAGLRVTNHDGLGARAGGGRLGDQAVASEQVDVEVGFGCRGTIVISSRVASRETSTWPCES